jgi:hypothetical protein
MPPNDLALELLLMMAHRIGDASGELRYGDFNAFRQVNSALYSCLNLTMWQLGGSVSGYSFFNVSGFMASFCRK